MSGYRAMKTRKKKVKLARKQLIITSLAVSILLGIVIGSIYAVSQNAAGGGTLYANLKGYLKSFADYQNTTLSAGSDVFRESLLKYITPVVIIWILAYIPAGGFITFGIIFLRGFGYGLTTAALIGSYGFEGVICAILLYLPQALILIPIYIFIAYNCFNFILTNMNSKADETGIVNYFVPLVIGCACSALAGAIDAFIVPILVERFL